MPQVSDPRLSTPEQASLSPIPGRRLFSRLASPFNTKARNLTEFYIDVNDPHRTYSPGDLVQGSVRLKLHKPLRVTHLVVCLHGFVQVYKTPGSPNEIKPSYLVAGRGKRSGGEYYGNGFASLFEDEVVLCGDGRLAEGAYQFNFELEFPDQDLPSSIEFERGTVSYLITATLTKPTPINPTVTDHQRVLFVERIDISPLNAPRPRTITLEPVVKRHRAKTQARKLTESSRKGDSNQNSEIFDPPRSSPVIPGPEPETRRSPSPSILSFESVHSSVEQTSQADGHRQSHGDQSDPGVTNSSKVSVAGRTVTATIESLQGGCLRGESISIRVHVTHAKPLKSLYGVIVTLYRHAKVDMHPAIPLGPTEKGVKGKFEDYYPKSVTGLGGLSFSGNGSSHVFRKDLAQSVVPLYIDPVTLSTEVHAKVRVPEDAFPSISTVPGGMISFKYYAEVMVDIQGKLASSDRSLANLGGLASNSSFVPLGGIQSANGVPFGTGIIDTAQLRRDKSVVSCSFEVVIGTQDTGRRKGKQRAEEPEADPPAPANVTEPREDTVNGAEQYPEEHSWQDYQWYHYPYDESGYYPRNGHPPNGYADQTSAWQWGHYYEEQQPHPMIPPPTLPENSQLSEKEQIRLQEQRLLPSQPPGVGQGHDTDGPSAPYIDEGNETHQVAPYYPEADQSSTGSARHESQAPQASTSTVPEYSPPSASAGLSVPNSAVTVRPTDDKRELERRELEQQDPPPPTGDSGTSNGPRPSSDGLNGAPSVPTQPSAPLADAVAGRSYDSHADATPTDERQNDEWQYSLPKYEERSTAPSNQN